MQKKPPSSKAASPHRAGRTATTQQTLSAAELTQALSRGTPQLAAVEEKALRMHYGVSVPRTLVLERVGQNHKESRDELLNIELNLLRQWHARAKAAPATHAGATALAAPPNPRRERIVAALKSKKPSR
jgi:hypothetical protein